MWLLPGLLEPCTPASLRHDGVQVALAAFGDPTVLRSALGAMVKARQAFGAVVALPNRQSIDNLDGIGRAHRCACTAADALVSQHVVDLHRALLALVARSRRKSDAQRVRMHVADLVAGVHELCHPRGVLGGSCKLAFDDVFFRRVEQVQAVAHAVHAERSVNVYALVLLEHPREEAALGAREMTIGLDAEAIARLIRPA